MPVAAPATAAEPTRLIAAVTLADIGFVNGLRFANLGGHHELFVPLPQSGDIAASELVLDLDDVSAHEARRNLEVQVNDRTVTAIVLDGKSRDRIVRIPLGRTKPKDGYLKLTFLYSGAATLDRCIDVRYVGDSLTIRPETAVEVDLGAAVQLDVATTAALMPRDVAVVLPGRRVEPSEMATAVTVARSLMSSGRHVTFYHGYSAATELAKSADAGRWSRGIVLVGPLAEATSVVDSPIAKVAGPMQSFGMLAAVRVAGQPALVVSDGDAVRAGRLFASPLLAATRGVAAATVGGASTLELPTDSVSFDQLAVAPAQAEVFGRADLVSVLDTRRLPAERGRRGFCSMSWWRLTAPAKRRSSASSSTSACSAARSPRPAKPRISICCFRKASSARPPMSARWCNATARKAIAASSRKAIRRKFSARPRWCSITQTARRTISPI